jgi:hypothetical protein
VFSLRLSAPTPEELAAAWQFLRYQSPFTTIEGDLAWHRGEDGRPYTDLEGVDGREVADFLKARIPADSFSLTARTPRGDYPIC